MAPGSDHVAAPWSALDDCGFGSCLPLYGHLLRGSEPWSRPLFRCSRTALINGTRRPGVEPGSSAIQGQPQQPSSGMCGGCVACPVGGLATGSDYRVWRTYHDAHRRIVTEPSDLQVKAR